MRHLILLIATLIVALGSSPALAATCTSTSDGTWSGAAGATGTATWDCGTPTAADDFVIAHTVTTQSDLGAAGGPMQGTITVASGGNWIVNTSGSGGGTRLDLFLNDSVEFQSGSTGTIQGKVLDPIGAVGITYPSATTIMFDLDLMYGTGTGADMDGPPWDICASSCTEDDVHVGTYIYVDWTKIGADSISQVVGNRSQALQTDFVDAPGLWLEVTAVDAVNNTITTTLPTLGSNTQAYHYNVPEAVSSNIVQNIIGGTAWTVASTTTAENNEGKRRYETLINSADAPFSVTNGHSFEGYLACKAGTDRCLRITTTEVNYSTTSEMFVTWSDPSDYWATGDELDIYYAKIRPGDKLVPINAVKFDFSGSYAAIMQGNNQFAIRGGSTLFDLEAVVFEDAYMKNTTVSEGAISLENYATSDADKSMSYVWATRCSAPARVVGVDTNSLPACIRVQDRIGTGVGARNVSWSHLTVTWPNESIDWTTNPGVDGFGQVAIQMTDQTGESIGSKTDFEAGTVPEWSNWSVRNLRIDGYTAGVGVATTGIMVNCPDDTFFRDVLILHSRSTKIQDFRHNGEDQLESYGATPTCGYDRFVIGASNVGATLGPIRHAQRGATSYSSFSTFGGSGRAGNAVSGWSAGDRPYINVTGPHTVATSSNPESHVTSFPNDASAGAYMSNFLTDGALGLVSVSYFERMGWFRSLYGLVPGRSCGQFTVGGFSRGDSAHYQPINALTGYNDGPCGTRWNSITIEDNTFLNVSRDYNNSSEQSCLADGTGSPGSGQYPCQGATAGYHPALFISGPTSEAVSVYMNRNLIHRHNRGATANSGPVFSILATEGTDHPLVSLTNTTSLNEAGTSNVVAQIDDRLITDMVLTNVWTSGGSTLQSCQVAGTFSAFSQTCDFTGSGGLDYSTDESPNGARSLYVSGDPTTPQDLYVLSASGGSGTPSEAQPKFSGIVLWEWPHAWMTPEIHGARRGLPTARYIPPVVRRRMGSGGGGRPTFAPTPFGYNGGGGGGGTAVSLASSSPSVASSLWGTMVWGTDLWSN